MAAKGYVGLSVGGQGGGIMRDRHAGEEDVFEAVQSEITATVGAAGATAIAARFRLSFCTWAASTESTLSLSCLIAGPEAIQLFSAKRIPRRKTILRHARTPRLSGSEIIRGY